MTYYDRTIDLKKYIRDVPDFPKPGVMFRDIGSLLATPEAFGACIDQLTDRCQSMRINRIGALDARGFIFGAPLAHRLRMPLFMIRKKGKLPGPTHIAQYALEYGMNTVEMSMDAVQPGERVAIVDDVLATGGSMDAAARLVKVARARVAAFITVIELDELGGRPKLYAAHDARVHSLITY